MCVCMHVAYIYQLTDEYLELKMMGLSGVLMGKFSS